VTYNSSGVPWVRAFFLVIEEEVGWDGMGWERMGKDADQTVVILRGVGGKHTETQRYFRARTYA
jgi:hypothetical protein